jgi:hypothetical protein
MSVKTLLTRGARWALFADSSSRRERRKRQSKFRSHVMEQLEDRLVLTPPPVITPPSIPAVLFNNKAASSTLAGALGFSASPPTIDSTGNIKLVFSNGGVSDVKVGVAVYSDQVGTAGASTNPATAGWSVDLSSEVLVGVQYYTVPENTTVTVYVSDIDCAQIDAFINMVGTNTVSNVVQQFTVGDATPAGASLQPDAGYNYTPVSQDKTSPNYLVPATNPVTMTPIINSHSGYNPVTMMPILPPNVVGTLVSFTNTSSEGTKVGSTTTYTSVCAKTALPLTWGYWKNHESAWLPLLPSFTDPANPTGPMLKGLTLGSRFYSVDDLNTIFDTSVQGNALIDLAHQEIAAKFNILNDSQHATSTVLAALTQADIDLAMINPSTGLPYNILTDFVATSSPLGQDMVNQSSTLDTFNSSGI